MNALGDLLLRRIDRDEFVRRINAERRLNGLPAMVRTSEPDPWFADDEPWFDDKVIAAVGKAMSEHYQDVGFDHYGSTCGAGCAAFVMERVAGKR